MASALFNSKLTLVRRDMNTVLASDAFADKRYVLLYFSAHWCPPCRGFTPQLKSFYERNGKSKNFEVVFVSLDNNEEEMRRYFRDAHGNWLALQFSDTLTLGKEWMNQYGLRGIPSLIILERGANGECTLVTKSARNMVPQDPEAAEFPWPGADSAAEASQKKMMTLIFGAIVLFVLWWIMG